MNKVIANYLERKGKQIRPIMVLLSARLLGEVNDRVIKGAVAVELLHNASLIHDDVVDDTRVRRDAATINGIWDNHLAVLIGDFFLSNSLRLAAETSDLRIVGSIASLGRLLSIGELDEIYTARFNNFDEKAYFEIIYRKTASLFVSCAEVGAYAAGAEDVAKIDALREFARLLGLCFQIRDDIFDYYDNADIGKPTGNDLREGKITLPLLYALDSSSAADRDDMLALAQKEELTTEEIDRLIEFAKREGGIEYAYSKMEQLRNRAAEIIAGYPQNDAIRSLMDIFDYIIARKS